MQMKLKSPSNIAQKSKVILSPNPVPDSLLEAEGLLQLQFSFEPRPRPLFSRPVCAWLRLLWLRNQEEWE